MCGDRLGVSSGGNEQGHFPSDRSRGAVWEENCANQSRNTHEGVERAGRERERESLKKTASNYVPVPVHSDMSNYPSYPGSLFFPLETCNSHGTHMFFHSLYLLFQSFSLNCSVFLSLAVSLSLSLSVFQSSLLSLPLSPLLSVCLGAVCDDSNSSC